MAWQFRLVVCLTGCISFYAGPATACSMVSGYRVPTNLELAAKAEAIVIAVVESERPGADERSSSILARPVTLLKGTTMPATVELSRAWMSDDPRRVIASAPRELRNPNPGALIGGCVRYTFSKGMNLVLFLVRDETGKLVPYRSSFSRDAEDVVDENALWVKAVREYAVISLTPKPQWKNELRRRIAALKADVGDIDAQAVAKDLAIELSGKRRPSYD